MKYLLPGTRSSFADARLTLSFIPIRYESSCKECSELPPLLRRAVHVPPRVLFWPFRWPTARCVLQSDGGLLTVGLRIRRKKAVVIIGW